MKLKDLFQDISVIGSNTSWQELDVPAISCDSRKEMLSGFLFMAIDGEETDGHKYIQVAIDKGAGVIVGTKEYSEVKDMVGSVPYIQVDRETRRETWAILSRNWFGILPLPFKLIAVTGTDGKTTTTHFLNRIFLESGKNVGLIGTVGVFFNDKVVEEYPHTTTPDAYDVYRFMKYFADHNADYVVLEATSFGMLHKRLYGLTFDICAMTNLTHEHLNLHKSLENYARAKLEVFKASKVKFLKWDEILHSKEVFSQLSDVREWSLDIIEELGIDKDSFRSRFVADYNFKNLAVALTIIKELGDPDVLRDLPIKVSELVPVNGRLNKVENDKGINIYIDYAHTPHGLRSVLEGVKSVRPEGSRIFVVFGCEGKRDMEKRPLMGSIAGDLADIVYLAPVDPRDEPVEKINSEIAEGFSSNPNSVGKELREFSSREEAIKEAISNAKPNDYVLLLGKGHEQTMNYGSGEVPYSDMEVVNLILNNL